MKIKNVLSRNGMVRQSAALGNATACNQIGEMYQHDRPLNDVFTGREREKKSTDQQIQSYFSNNMW
jgi:hypothetical protein